MENYMSLGPHDACLDEDLSIENPEGDSRRFVLNLKYNSTEIKMLWHILKALVSLHEGDIISVKPDFALLQFKTKNMMRVAITQLLSSSFIIEIKVASIITVDWSVNITKDCRRRFLHSLYYQSNEMNSEFLFLEGVDAKNKLPHVSPDSSIAAKKSEPLVGKSGRRFDSAPKSPRFSSRQEVSTKPATSFPENPSMCSKNTSTFAKQFFPVAESRAAYSSTLQSDKNRTDGLKSGPKKSESGCKIA